MSFLHLTCQLTSIQSQVCYCTVALTLWISACLQLRTKQVTWFRRTQYKLQNNLQLRTGEWMKWWLPISRNNECCFLFFRRQFQNIFTSSNSPIEMLVPYSHHLLCGGSRDFLSSPAGKHGNAFVCLRKGTNCSCARQSHTDPGTKAVLQLRLPWCKLWSYHSPQLTFMSRICFVLLFSPTDHVAVYFQQRAYDLSFMFIGDRNGKAEGSQKRLNLMGSPLFDRRAGKHKGRASQPLAETAHTPGITSWPQRGLG